MSTRGQQDAFSANSEFNATAFLIEQMLGRLNTSTLVKVVAVTNAGGVEPVGYVDVLPLVSMVDGNNNAAPHSTIFGVPYFRLKGGANAVILDPEVGDIGMAAFADHSIANVIASQEQSTPGSFRRFSMADAMYFGGFLNGEPTQYVRFSSAGIELHSPVQIKMDAPDILLVAPTIEMNATTSITATTPTFIVNGDTILNGGISQGAGGSGGAVNLIGPAIVTNELTANGISTSTHDHDVQNVQGGNSTVTSDGPNP